ncbi:MAG: hypothetical protein EXX96DRAFT_487742 [Benjaminiella poitrasii]|nr:MAG: hypothetical protein EXX96DRAFT_487742 [Benjaminiella poitrasii]
MVSPMYKLPKKPVYPFAIEREVIAQVEAARKQAFEAEEAFNLRKKRYEEEKINKQKIAARKIAPGFLDTDTRILQPQQTYVYEHPLLNKSEENSEENSEATASPKISDNQKEEKKSDHFDYLKFEQGLAPADPWDTPENDMVALRSLLGSPKSSSYSPKSATSTPPPYPSQLYPHPQPQSQQQQQQNTRLYQKNEGVYWNFQPNSTNSYPLPQQHLQRQNVINSVPALPPKLFSNNSNSPTSLMPTPSTSSPIIPTNNPIHQQQTSTSHGLSSVTPPPLPPLPSSQSAIPYEDLITELGNMGFSRTQAIDALKKNDYDMMKATNFLLDQA